MISWLCVVLWHVMGVDSQFNYTSQKMKETITIALKQEDVNTDPDLWRLKTRMTVTETLDQLSITQGQVNTAALERKRPKTGMVLEVVTTNRGFVLIPSDCFSLVLLFVRFVAADGVWWYLQTIQVVLVVQLLQDGASICAFVKNVCCAFQHTLISMEEIPGGEL